MEEEKIPNVIPRKMNKLREWSISARALKNVINSALRQRCRYDYKFNAVWDDRYRVMRIWNVKTSNVICTIKRGNSSNDIFIRYRNASIYRPVMAELNGRKYDRCKIISMPSENLRLHRGNSERATSVTNGDKKAQFGFRRARYEQAVQKSDPQPRDTFSRLQRQYMENYISGLEMEPGAVYAMPDWGGETITVPFMHQYTGGADEVVETVEMPVCERTTSHATR